MSDKTNKVHKQSIDTGKPHLFIDNPPGCDKPHLWDLKAIQTKELWGWYLIELRNSYQRK